MITALPYAGRKVAVLGLARSGRAAALSLAESGAEVLAWDDSQKARDEFVESSRIRMTDLAAEDCRDWAALVMSPGIPLTHPTPHPLAVRARAAGVPVIGDIELLWQGAPDATFIGITGTNGKSTTTSLIHHIFAQAEQSVAVGGNLGIPVLTLPLLGGDGTYVVEMSSYQLDLIDRTRFQIAILLNVTPDHLDRHGDMAGYISAKRRIFTQQQAGDTAIVGIDDEPSRDLGQSLAAEGRNVVRISSVAPVEQGIGVSSGQLMDGSAPILDLTSVATLPGKHNWQNAAAAFAACRAAGLDRKAIIAGLQTYPGLAHRQETIGRRGNITYINDSKATNADAAAKALGCYSHIYWIVGGVAKEGGIEPLRPDFRRVTHAYLIGDAAAEFAKTLSGAVPVTIAQTLEIAVRAATNDAARDPSIPTTVLLSPACASFDQYPNFEVRGDAFRSLVHTVIAEAA